MPHPLPSRRAVLAAAGSAAVGLAGCGGSDSTSRYDPAAAEGAQVGTIESAFAPGGRAQWFLRAPARPKALLVSLHGRGGDASDSFRLGFGGAAVDAGLALVSVSGGNGYWHARRDGTDSGRLVLEELIPLALETARMSDDARVGFIGWSMGGYGSLLLAGRLPRDRVVGVAPMSTALWTSAGGTAPGAFDDAEDYAAHDVFAPARRLPGIPVSIACGTEDPFIGTNRAYVAERPATTRLFDKGEHDNAYWTSHAPRLIAWLGSIA